MVGSFVARVGARRSEQVYYVSNLNAEVERYREQIARRCS